MGASEEELVAAGRGKWSRPGVPHRGWRCVDTDVLNSPSFRCEMCEAQQIRFVHFMQHPDYPEVLGVGCVCSGHMEADLAASRNREAAMKNRIGKRRRWLSRAWKQSQKGNRYLVADGYRVTVYRRGEGWASTVAALDDSALVHSRRNYPSSDAAALAAFDLITRRVAGA